MKILFIGNSATYYNDMPKLLEALLRDNGVDASVDSVTKGGRHLYENLAIGDARGERIRALAAENEYDVLFLQDHAMEAMGERERFFDSISRLMATVRAKRYVAYQTAARHPGCAFYEKYGGTNDSMTEILHEAYSEAGERCGVEVSYAGDCVHHVLTRFPDADLYAADLAHLAYMGSCIVAIAHYKRIMGELPQSYASMSFDKETYLAAIKEAVELFVK